MADDRGLNIGGLLATVACLLLFIRVAKSTSDDFFKTDNSERQLLLASASNIDRRRTLAVQGSADIFVVPDICYIRFTRETKDEKTASRAHTENGRVMKLIASAVRETGIDDKDIQTTGLSMGPTYRYEANNKRIFDGYRVAQDLTVKVRGDMSKISAVIDASITAGATEVSSIQFTVENPKRYSEEIRMEALSQVSE
jgi:uncharacterized protein YggE